MLQSTVLISALSSTPANRASSVTGFAYDIGQDQLRYVETYQQIWSGNRLLHSTVEYRAPDDTLLAVKQLDYHQHPYAPDYDFTNQSNGYAESIQWLDQNHVLVRHRKAGHSWQEKTLQVPGPVVADAGFNAFLQDHLALLQEGHPLQFNFINPARLAWYRFQASPERQDGQQITVRIEPRNALLRLLLDPIYLTYEIPQITGQTIPGQTAERPRLLQYSGLTNMAIDGATPLVANIFYRYSEQQQPQVVYRF